jgi:hypothetical protein
MKLRSLTVVAVMVGCGLSTLALAAPANDTTRAMEAMSVEQADAKAKRDLLAILRANSRFRSGMFQTVRGLYLYTPPRGVGVTGLCTRDRMLLQYLPATGKGEAKDRPVRVSGFESQHLFHVVKTPLIDSRDQAPEQTTWNQDCSAPTIDKATDWFPASNSDEAARVVNMIVMMTEEVTSGRLKFESCKNNTSTDCEQVLLKKATLSKIESITPCYAAPYHACYDVTFDGSVGLRIKAAIDDGSIMPEAIDEVTDWDFIAVT